MHPSAQRSELHGKRKHRRVTFVTPAASTAQVPPSVHAPASASHPFLSFKSRPVCGGDLPCSGLPLRGPPCWARPGASLGGNQRPQQAWPDPDQGAVVTPEGSSHWQKSPSSSAREGTGSESPLTTVAPRTWAPSACQAAHGALLLHCLDSGRTARPSGTFQPHTLRDTPGLGASTTTCRKPGGAALLPPTPSPRGIAESSLRTTLHALFPLSILHSIPSSALGKHQEATRPARPAAARQALNVRGSWGAGHRQLLEEATPGTPKTSS